MTGMPLNETNVLFKVINEMYNKNVNKLNLAGQTKNEPKKVSVDGIRAILSFDPTKKKLRRVPPSK